MGSFSARVYHQNVWCTDRAFFFISPSFSQFTGFRTAWLTLKYFTCVKGHFTSGKLLYRMGKQCRKGSGCRWESHGRFSCSTAMTPATSKMSSQVSFVSTAQGIFNVMIWATFSTVLQSFINLALWFFIVNVQYTLSLLFSYVFRSQLSSYIVCAFIDIWIHE